MTMSEKTDQMSVTWNRGFKKWISLVQGRQAICMVNHAVAPAAFGPAISILELRARLHHPETLY